MRYSQVTLNKKSFAETLSTILEKFELKSTIGTLEVDAEENRFALTAIRTDENEVRAFGPCVAEGPSFSMQFDLAEMGQQIAQDTSDPTSVTLHFEVADEA